MTQGRDRVAEAVTALFMTSDGYVLRETFRISDAELGSLSGRELESAQRQLDWFIAQGFKVQGRRDDVKGETVYEIWAKP